MQKVAPSANASHEPIESSGFSAVRMPYLTIATMLGLVSVMVIGMSGALVSLGDILFPADSLRHAVVQDFSSSGHILLRLRLLHPIAVVVGSIYVLWLVHAFWRKRERSPWMAPLTVALAAQIVLRAMNVSLGAPVWLQLTHLLVAEIFWILLVPASADQSLATHRSDVPLSRKKRTAADWRLGFKTADYISRGGGHFI